MLKRKRLLFRATDFLDKEEEKRIMSECAKDLAKPYILQIIIHEIRHGFGYRHIFSASADKDNYYKDYDEMRGIFGDNILEEVVTEGSHSAPKYCLCDGLSCDGQASLFPFRGKCDIMATRFLYFDQVGLKNGKDFVDTSSGDQSILQSAKAQNIDIDSIKRCYVCGGRPTDVKP